MTLRSSHELAKYGRYIEPAQRAVGREGDSNFSFESKDGLAALTTSAIQITQLKVKG